jgi:peroxiredoxin
MSPKKSLTPKKSPTPAKSAKKAKKQELAPKQKPAGQTIPSLEVELVPKPEDVQTVLPNYRGATADLAELVKGKTVALIGVPAAFDKISEQQIPTFKKHRQQLADAGVEEIFVVAGNDAVVMRAWQTQIDALGQLNFLADPAGNVAKALKLADKDLSAQLSTPRSRRFALVVRDGLVTFAAIAGEDPAPTFAERLLAAIDVDPEIIGAADA